MRTESASHWSDARRIGVSPWIAVVVLILGLFGSVSLVAASSSIDADTARYQAMGQFYLAKSEAASSARWAALAGIYGQGASAGSWTDVAAVIAERMGAQAGLDADAARYQAMSEYYLAAAERGIEASAARYQAMGEFYLAMAGDDLLAANPELRLARAGYTQALQSDDLLAANPELRLVRAYAEGQDLILLGTCSPTSEDLLAANPELILVRSEGAC